MSTPNEPAFDWEQAASLLGEDPAHVEPDMAAIVLELVTSADGQFDELAGKDFATDRKTVSSLAHALRGCLLNFGFTEVGAILQYIEKGPCTAEEFPQKLAQARAAFLASKKLLAARYPSVGIV
jgi:HPt (histidine-containing phosphotransfer) domain-containing protein